MALARLTALPGSVATRVKNAPIVRDTIRPKLRETWGHAKRELGPPSMKDLPEIKATARNMSVAFLRGEFMNTSVRSAFRNTLVATEVLMWFFVGEIIGKRALFGYQVGEWQDWLAM